MDIDYGFRSKLNDPSRNDGWDSARSGWPRLICPTSIQALSSSALCAINMSSPSHPSHPSHLHHPLYKPGVFNISLPICWWQFHLVIEACNNPIIHSAHLWPSWTREKISKHYLLFFFSLWSCSQLKDQWIDTAYVSDLINAQYMLLMTFLGIAFVFRICTSPIIAVHP